MGLRYVIQGTQAVVSPTDSVLGLTSSATAGRPYVYEIDVFSDATPANNVLKLILQRYTAAGTATADVPVLLDPGGKAAISQGAENHTAEPTYTALQILSGDGWGFNQQYPFRWVAVDGGGFYLPATAANGIGLQPVHASATPNVGATMYFEE